MKKWIIRMLIALLVMVLGLIAYVEFKKEAIVSGIIQDFAEDLDGEIIYGDIGVSFLSTFPRMGLSLEDVKVISHIHPSASELLRADRMSVEVDVKSIWQNQQAIPIRAINLDGLDVRLYINEEGEANYNIYESDQSSEKGSDIELNELTITNSVLRYTDMTNHTSTLLEEIESTGRISYTDQGVKFLGELSSRLTVDMGKLSPNYSVNIIGETELEINSAQTELDIKTGKWSFNHLPMDITGNISQVDDAYKYNLEMSSPSTEVKQLLSIIPSIYRKEFSALVSHGSYTLRAKVNGTTSDDYPRYDVNIDIADGSLSHPGIGQSIDKVALTGNFVNTSSNHPYTSIRINDMAVISGKSFLNGDIALNRQSREHLTKVDISGDINLKEVAQALMIEHTDRIDGSLQGTIDLLGSVEPTGQSAQLNVFEADISSQSLSWTIGDLPVNLRDFKLKGTTEALITSVNEMSYGDVITDADIILEVTTPLDLLMGKVEDGSARLNIATSKINMNAMEQAEEEGSDLSYPIPDINIATEVVIDTLHYEDYNIFDLKGKGQISEETSIFNTSIGALNGGSFKGKAKLGGLLSYVLNNDTLRGHIDLTSDVLNIKEYMAESDAVVDTSLFIAPDNLDIDIDYAVDQIKYGKIDLLKSLGNLGLKDGNLVMESQCNLLGGEAVFSVAIDADQKDRYHLNLDVKVSDLKMNETAQKLSILSEILPIANLLEGSYDAVLKWESDLDQNYIPDLSSLTAYGEILTKDGRIIGQLPGQEVIDELIDSGLNKAIDIANTKKFFLVKDGRVTIEDIILEKDGIKATIGGSHGLNNDLAYDLNIQVPKEKWRGLSNTASKLSKEWTDKLSLSDVTEDLVFQVNGYISGMIVKPEVKIKGIQSINSTTGRTVQEVVKEEVETKVDSVQQVVVDSIKTLEQDARAKIDSVQEVVTTAVDSTLASINEVADSTIASLEDLIAEETSDLKDEGNIFLDSLKSGNLDSALSQIKILIDQKGKRLDSLKLPTNIKNRLPIFNRKGN